MPRYGYARVSSTDQDCALQEARLRAAGCEVIRAERVSGKSRDGRDELARIMDFLHAGDEQGSRINPIYPYAGSTGASQVSSFARFSRVREPRPLRN